VTLYIVRHAKAGVRSSWNGEDAERPLSATGWKQAHKVGKRIAAAGASTLVASPYTRCIQTLEPLAVRLGLDVSRDDRLLEGTPFEKVLELLDELPDGGVICTHGDVIPDVVNALVRRGLHVRSRADWRKASVWAIHRSAKGRYSRAVVWPPPGA
jgi:8-oxo-dGTP diphosphatase